MEFPSIRFSGELRPSQKDVVEIARRQLDEGRHRLHIVSPPGSGKTVVGLYLWAALVRRPALVLSPNSAIQSQWAARVALFDVDDSAQGVITSTDADTPGLLTSLTYQSVTLPRRGGDDLDREAAELWIDRLIETQQAKDPVEADVWIADLQRHHPQYYSERLSAYRKQARDAAAIGGQAMDMLHRSSLDTVRSKYSAGSQLLCETWFA